MITRFVFNKVLHHVVLSWIISSNKQMKYDIIENNHPDWLNKGPRYNTAIFLNRMELCLMILLEMTE